MIETGWVIEFSTPPFYWCGVIRWTANHMDAIRFARKLDAERVLDTLSFDLRTKARVTEHSWG